MDSGSRASPAPRNDESEFTRVGITQPRREQFSDASSLAREVLRLERDRRSVRGALCCASPGIAIAREHLAIRHAFRSDNALKRIEPMPVIGLASIGIAGGLGALDLLREHCCPLRPRE